MTEPSADFSSAAFSADGLALFFSDKENLLSAWNHGERGESLRRVYPSPSRIEQIVPSIDRKTLLLRVAGKPIPTIRLDLETGRASELTSPEYVAGEKLLPFAMDSKAHHAAFIPQTTPELSPNVGSPKGSPDPTHILASQCGHRAGVSSRGRTSLDGKHQRPRFDFGTSNLAKRLAYQ